MLPSYYAPVLPPSPDPSPMSTAALPLPVDLLHSWHSWRHTKQDAPLTPPLSTAPQRRVLHTHTVLPPISYFDRDISRRSPELPEDPFAPPSYSLDWFGSDSHRSSRFIAEKTTSASPSKRNRVAASQQTAFSPHSNSSTALLQFSVAPPFVRFVQKVLETTQVSQSVIVLSLNYIYRLKARNPFTSGQAGSEYRVAIAALMLANKFVDDNTYTNKTWSEVSGIELSEINRMEREFLMGIDFDLYVNKPTYESWLNLLTGLVMAKEKDSKYWQRSRCSVRASHLARPPCHRHAHLNASRASSHRARSSSPRRASGCPVAPPASYPHSHHLTPLPPPPPRTVIPQPVAQPVSYPSPARPDIAPGSKRTASAAFSPTSASFSATQQPPAQAPRRMQGLSLDIPQPMAHSRETSASPLESLQSFSKLSLGASPVDGANSQAWVAAVRPEDYPRTLHLYFYSLAGSPMESEEERRTRKARLRYHQAPLRPRRHTATRPRCPWSCNRPRRALTSPFPCPRPAAGLPPFSEVSQGWSQPMHATETTQLPPIHVDQDGMHGCSIPSAPFANAGPPEFTSVLR
ncbi:cyclin-domain-containing protein [Epithele typhae]|uniref:cyclin-domain-containing protein n=1 Tax=Epithele typhae TaxID=378194 RepID=UPI0020083FA3|nr:cyclin-domain-containing protein [Epithele typhae]KAH9927419.1 cyclin-domain-containing protein [Epithele typhae]